MNMKQWGTLLDLAIGFAVGATMAWMIAAGMGLANGPLFALLVLAAWIRWISHDD